MVVVWFMFDFVFFDVVRFIGGNCPVLEAFYILNVFLFAESF